jgi:hypothetical protein
MLNMTVNLWRINNDTNASAIVVRTGMFLVARGVRHQKRPSQSVDSYKKGVEKSKVSTSSFVY